MQVGIRAEEKEQGCDGLGVHTTSPHILHCIRLNTGTHCLFRLSPHILRSGTAADL